MKEAQIDKNWEKFIREENLKLEENKEKVNIRSYTNNFEIKKQTKEPLKNFVDWFLFTEALSATIGIIVVSSYALSNFFVGNGLTLQTLAENSLKAFFGISIFNAIFAFYYAYKKEKKKEN
jgi:hypothetical protein